jgi:cyclopropane-fatty-acyl-phospholipid synthase
MDGGAMNPLLSFYLHRLFRQGNLRITDAGGGDHRIGDGTGDPIHVRFRDPATERAVAINPGLRFGEAYMEGRIDLIEGTIFDLLKLISENAGSAGAAEPWMKAIDRVRLSYRRIVQDNTPTRARRNVHHHYDLSAEFYGLFLDSDRQYSCAYFETPDSTLEEAQLAKKRHIAAKLLFDHPGLDVLDIGCGWGGMGLYLAENCGAEVKGITLSTEQHALANERARAAGLEDHAHFEIEDYRAVTGGFDRIVSVGMFEHVGRDFYDDFFHQSSRLLRDDGVMLLHTIGRYEPPANTNAFISKYIFPGGYIPALSEIMPAVERAGLIVCDVEVLRLHYAETLKHWRLRFAARRDEAKAIYDERFCRMWEFYLAASECTFRWQDLVVFQLQLAHRHGVVPITRGYIAEAEAALRAREAENATSGSQQAAE